LGPNKKVYVWRKKKRGEMETTLSWNLQWQTDPTAKFWDCLTYGAVGTLTPIEGNINSRKYIEILDGNLWPVIAKYIDRTDHISSRRTMHQCIHLDRLVHGKPKTVSTPWIWPPQSPGINIIANVWRTVKEALWVKSMFSFHLIYNWKI
jgi:hypothetical protein